MIFLFSDPTERCMERMACALELQAKKPEELDVSTLEIRSIFSSEIHGAASTGKLTKRFWDLLRPLGCRFECRLLCSSPL
eukprot:8973395-Pyramimonas_sp.AAC.1